MCAVLPNILVSPKTTLNNDSNKFIQFQCHTILLAYFIYPYTISVWNTLQTEVLLVLPGFQQAVTPSTCCSNPPQQVHYSPANFSCTRLHIFINGILDAEYITNVCASLLHFRPAGLFGVIH